MTKPHLRVVPVVSPQLITEAPALARVLIETLEAIELVRKDNPKADLLWLDSMIPVIRAKLDRALGPGWENERK